MIAATKTAKDRYTEAQWQKLHEYWGHPLFQKSRPLGYLVCLAAIIIAIPPLISTNWIKLEVQKPVNYTYSKLILITAVTLPLYLICKIDFGCKTLLNQFTYWTTPDRQVYGRSSSIFRLIIYLVTQFVTR